MVLSHLELPPQGPGVISGLREGEDAGAVRLSDDLVLVQSIDYITPVVDDPYVFGAIAAANALSDLYTMGARPLAALNLLGFPAEQLGAGVAAQIMQGALDKVTEAGAHVLGGHTVEDKEVKFGLAVTGIAKPEQLIRRSGARPGDRLVLTKPIGGGVVSTAIKARVAQQDDVAELTAVMTRLNDFVEEMRMASVHACTDVTGFGLVGHAASMAKDSGVGIRIYWNRVPCLRRAPEYAAQAEFVPGGTLRNELWAQERARFDPRLDPVERTLACDAMTSGGLLIAVPPAQTDRLLTLLSQRRPPALAVIGEVVTDHPGYVEVTLDSPSRT